MSGDIKEVKCFNIKSNKEKIIILSPVVICLYADG